MRIPRRLAANKPSLALNVALASFVLVGGGLAYRTVAVSDVPASNAANERTATVATGNVSQTVSASGSVSSAKTANVSFVTNGTVTAINVKVGDTVKMGQVLAEVDPSSAEDNLATAEANLEAAEDSLDRVEDDSDSDDASISSAEAQVSSAQATVKADKKALTGTVLKAPMAGTVTAVNGSVGNSSSGGGTTGSSSSSGLGTDSSSSSSASSSSTSSSGFVEIADVSKLQATADFAEADATKLKVGQAASITWSALPDATATGKVTSISPTATTSNNVNSYPVKVSIESVPKGAHLGQTVTVDVTTASASNVLRVPTNAVRSGGGVHTAQVRTGSQTQTVTVQVGVQGDSYYEITSGLSAGQTVVLQQSTSTGSGSGLPNFPGGGFGGAGGLGGAQPGGR